MIFVVFGLFVVNLVWSIWALTYSIVSASWHYNKFAEVFSSLGLTFGAVMAGSFGSQLVKMIIALS
jgi:hypothetical protein